MENTLIEGKRFSFSPRGKLKKIMFVDDDTLIHPIVEKGFKNFYNIHCLYCSSGTEALSKVADFMPDLLILDVMMPELDGISVMKELQKDDKTKGIPIVFLTGNDKIKDLENILAMGPIGIILKPINLKTFAPEIHDIWSEGG